MKQSLVILAICIAIVPGQAYNYESCYLSSFTNFWTLTFNPWWAVFAEGVTSQTNCNNLVSWVNYLNRNYASGSAGLSPTCNGCSEGQICVARPALTSWACGPNPSGSTFTNEWLAILALFTATASPSTAPISACYCPYLNDPLATTSSFVNNLNAWIAALLNPSNPSGFFMASFTNATLTNRCVTTSNCPSNQFYFF